MEIVEGQNMIEIHGDLLESILSRVPLLDLAYASRVSKSWEYSVQSSLLHISKIKPWLFIHTQCRKSLKRKITLAYDPRSDVWIKVTQPQPITSEHLSVTLQSSNSDFLYQLSPNKLSISLDPLHLTWTHVPAPRAWRTDPIVSRVGSRIIVAGGCAWFEDDPMSVEMYDMETSHWSTCQSLPDIFKHSAAATWLSVASNTEFMYIVEKSTGVLCSYNPTTNKWVGPYDLKPDPGVLFSALGFAGDDLILAGIIRDSRNIESLKIWKIETESMELDEIGEIPEGLMEKLKGEDSDLSSISLMAGKDLIYICKISNPEEVIIFEGVNGNNWKWRSVENIGLNDERKIGERMVMSCGSVGISDLHLAMTFADLELL